MGGGNQESNVIKPEFGAAKYLYVDPRASEKNPSIQRDREQQLIEAVNRLLGIKYVPSSSQPTQEQPTLRDFNF